MDNKLVDKLTNEIVNQINNIDTNIAFDSAFLIDTYHTLFSIEQRKLGSVNKDLVISLMESYCDKKQKALINFRGEALENAIDDDAFRASVLKWDEIVYNAAVKYLKTNKINNEEIEEILMAKSSFKDFGSMLESEYKHLSNELGNIVSESLLDCYFLLNGGDPSSFRMNNYRNSR